MWRNIVILVLAVLVVAAAVPTDLVDERNIRISRDASDESPPKNAEKTLEFLTPIVDATDQAFVLTGQLLNNTITGITNALDIIKHLLTGSPITTVSSTKGTGPIVLLAHSPTETQAVKPT